MTKDHWKRNDFRLESLSLTIEGLEISIEKLEKKLKEVYWYDAIWFLEEVEPIIGLSFIAFQNYINSSIYDRYGNTETKYERYKLGNLIGESGRTDIELIIGIANYFKHRDEDKELRKHTREILIDLKLLFDKETDITNSVIIKGLQYISEQWELSDIIKILTSWRNILWMEENTN